MQTKKNNAYLLMRLKSNLLVAPSGERDAEGFFSEVRETEAFPTEKQLYGMIECALGYRYIHEKEKSEIEKKIVFDGIVRTPKEYYKEYQAGHRTQTGWYSSFLRTGYVVQNPEEERVVVNKNTCYPGVSHEFTAFSEDANMKFYTITSFNRSEEDAIKSVFSETENADVYCPSDKSLNSFVCKKTIIDDETIVTGAYVYPNAYVATVFVAKGKNENDIEKLISGLEFYGPEPILPYQIFADLVTAKSMFEWDWFPQANGGKKNAPPPMTRKKYLSDADFLVRVYGDEETLKKVSHALDFPIFPYYFGDRKCMPSIRVNNGIWKDRGN